MKNQLNIFNPIINFFTRFNLIIFIIVIVCGLSAAVITIKDIVQYTYDEKNYSSDDDSITFDESTINRINQLNSNNSTNSSQEMTGRTSIFSE